MCLDALGCKLIFWYLVAAAMGIAASVALNYVLMDTEYATSPANQWLLIGGVTSTSIDFRIRLADDFGNPWTMPDNSRLVIATDENLDDIILEYILVGEEETDSTIINDEYGIHALSVTGLIPLRRYYYGVLSSTLKSGILKGRFQTPAVEGTAFNFSIAASACSFTGSKQRIFDRIREDHPGLQLFLHLGDFHYEDINSDNLNERLDAISTVLNSEPQAALYRSVPMAYTWDDHDFLGNEVPGETRSAEVRDTARLSYDLAFPHYPFAVEALTDNTTSVPIYHAFTIGKVRFIMLDLQSEKETDSIYSTQQRDWLFSELEQASQFDFVVLISSKPWIGMETEQNGEGVFGSWIQDEYSVDRSALSNIITEAIGGEDGPQNLLVLAGDAHMVAFDDGTNTYFGDSLSGAPSFPLLQTAALDRLGSSKGGPYSEGCWAYDGERTHQYSTLDFEVQQDGDACVQIRSFSVDEWDWKDMIFERRLCGKIFSPGNPAPTSADDAVYCHIRLISDGSLAFYIIAAIICLCLAIGTCVVVGCEPGSSQGLFARICLGLVAALAVWVAVIIVVCLAVIIPVANGIPQYNLRWSFLVVISTLFLSTLFLFIVFCCCSTPKRSRQRAKAEAKDEAEVFNARPSITRPSVLKTVAEIEVNEENLPEGVILTGGKKLHAEGLTGEGVKVAVIDSGIDQDHPGFNGAVKEQNWLRAGTPLSEDDHGTHVAGTIHLMAPKAHIYDYRVFGKDGSLGVDAAVAKSIRLATDSGCQVINMSLGGPFPNDEIWEAVQYANKRGVLLVCAAGNEGDNNPLTNEISFPASYKECISVAAVMKQEGFPVAVFSNSNPLVDVAGIGVDVVSFKPGGGFQMMSGTSMASPHVAGLIACLMTKGRITDPAKVFATLNDLALDIGAEGIDNATGIGFVTYLDKDTFDKMMQGKTQEDVTS